MNTSPSQSSFGVTTSHPMASPVPESSLDSVITLDLNVKFTAFLLTTMLIIYLSFKQGWMQLTHIRMFLHAVFRMIQSFLLLWRGHASAPTPIGTANGVPIDDIPTAINCEEHSNSISHSLKYPTSKRGPPFWFDWTRTPRKHRTPWCGKVNYS